MIPEIKRLEGSQGFGVEWIPMEIHSNTPTEGVSLMEYLGPRKVVKAAKFLEDWARTKDIPFYLPDKLYNAQTVNLLTAYGRSRTDLEELIDEIFRRVFVYNENISDHDIIYKICLNLGLSFHDFMEHVRKGSLEGTIKLWEGIIENQKIDMVPTLLEGDRIIHQGVCSYDELVRMLK
jgi:predicted DsbA family dithiol-disulfide isomerase